MIEDIKFTVIENGKEKEFIILDSFSKNNKNYLIYIENGKEDIYSSLYEYKNNNIKIIPIESDSDYDVVDEYLSNL